MYITGICPSPSALTGISNVLGQGGASTHVFEGHNIRVVEIDGAPWFVALDAIKAIGLDAMHGARIHLVKLEKSERQVLTRKQLPGEAWSFGKAQSITVINESGLYKLIMRSDKPEARAFQTWVTGTVLPSIRKDGGYVLGEEKVVSGEMSEADLQAKIDAMRDAKVERLIAERLEGFRKDLERS